MLEQDWGPANFLRVVPRERVTHVSQIPSFYAALLGSSEHEAVDLLSIRVIMLAAAAYGHHARPDQGPAARRGDLLSYYGQTEAP